MFAGEGGRVFREGHVDVVGAVSQGHLQNLAHLRGWDSGCTGGGDRAGAFLPPLRAPGSTTGSTQQLTR